MSELRNIDWTIAFLDFSRLIDILCPTHIYTHTHTTNFHWIYSITNSNILSYAHRGYQNVVYQQHCIMQKRGKNICDVSFLCKLRVHQILLSFCQCKHSDTNNLPPLLQHGRTNDEICWISHWSWLNDLNAWCLRLMMRNEKTPVHSSSSASCVLH